MISGRIFTPRVIGTWTVVALVMLLMPSLQRMFGFALYNLIFLYLVFFWVTQATSWNIFSGYSGYFSFGQAAFYGSGMYATAILVTRHDWDLLPTLPVAALVGGVIAAAMGVLTFRMRKLSGEIFALFTLAMSLGLGALANNWMAIDGGRGISLGTVNYPDVLGSVTEMLYYLGLLVALSAVLAAYAIQHSRFGAGLFAIRDDEKVAEAIGVPTFRYKLALFAVTGTISGLSGGLHAVQVNFISPQSAYGLRVPIFVILMSVVGGRRHWSGPVIGAVLIYTITDRLVGAGHAELNQVMLAVVLIAATLFLRGGITQRLMQNPRPTVIVFGLVFLGAMVLGGQSAITSGAIAMIVAMVMLFIPDRYLHRRKPPDDPDAEGPADTPDPAPPAEGSLDAEQGSVVEAVEEADR